MHTAAGAGKRRPPQGRRSPAPRPALAGAALVVAGIGLGATTALTITAETASQLTATGGLATFAGNLTGMAGTYLALLMVLLVSRIPFVEQVFGQDGLLRWHRRLAPWPISLLVAHAVLLVAGYAQAAKADPWHEVNTLLFSYPDVLIATIGLGLMLLAQFLQVVQHYSPLQAGLRTLPWTAMPVFIAPVAGALSDRIGGRALLATGLGLQAIGLGWLATVVSPTVPYLTLVPAFVVSGVGMSLFFAPVANVVLSSVRRDQEGIASGANNAIRELGGVFGIAVLGAVFSPTAVTPAGPRSSPGPRGLGRRGGSGRRRGRRAVPAPAASAGSGQPHRRAGRGQLLLRSANQPGTQLHSASRGIRALPVTHPREA